MNNQVEAGEYDTALADDHFDLISVLYHALEGAATYEIYIQDAEEVGDEELVDFFQQLYDENCQRAERAKQLLTKRLTQEAAMAK